MPVLPITCPVCKAVQVKSHCPQTNATCTWARCPNKACGVTVDLKAKRGYRPGPQHQPVTW